MSKVFSSIVEQCVVQIHCYSKRNIEKVVTNQRYRVFCTKPPGVSGSDATEAINVGLKDSKSMVHQLHNVGKDGTRSLTADEAFQLLMNLKDDEIRAMQAAMKKYNASSTIQQLRDGLAGSRWRLRFTRRRTADYKIGQEDPTGTYCEIPEDWFKNKLAKATPLPEAAEFKRLLTVNCVPFIGFGFLDNFIMIIAGDYIEWMLGSFMCISTMAAAALGNTISDIIGLGSTHYIENACTKIGLTPPRLTPAQMELPKVRATVIGGRLIGIVVGCLLGMSPLLFLSKSDDTDTPNDDKTDKKIIDSGSKSS